MNNAPAVAGEVRNRIRTMKLKSIKIKNIRSFKEETVFSPRNDFNVLIGPNGSGKSNLMDIIYVTLRHYFLYPYQQTRDRNENGLNVQLNVLNNPCGVVERVLSKYAGCNEQSEIKISLEVTKADIANLETIKNNKANLKALMGTYSYNDFTPKRFLEKEEIEVSEGQVYEYNIVEYRLSQIADPKAAYYHDYLNAVEGISLAAKELGIELIPPMLYISPFRTANRDTLEISLSSNGYHLERGAVARSTSRTTSSLITLASLFFAEKRRDFESKPQGYAALWTNDKDVKFVSESLESIGYSWDIKLIDRNRNTYTIQLRKDGRDFLLNEASSGEVELINFIFGLITLDLQGGIIIIDEPELHLHPQWLAILRDFFMKFSDEKKNQMMVITHSPTFINTATYSYISRVFKGEDGTSKIHKVEEEEAPETKDRLHFINATNNEKVFFSDFVLMVEGDTDEIVFKTILEDIKKERKIKANIEVMQVRGKTNYDKFKSFLLTLRIPSAFIGDIDNINQMAAGNAEIKAMLMPNAERIARLVIKNPGARDNEGLLSELRNAISTGDKERLQSFYDYIVSFRTKLRQDLVAEQRENLKSFIEAQYANNVFILQDGEIEAFFPDGFKGKDLDKVLTLLKKENFELWKNEDGYKKLYKLVIKILNQNRLCN